jgi:PIN domain nuclease of toxin-antitoxin system
VRLLLDTQAALWWLSADDRLGEEAARHLRDDTNQFLLSAAVVWEVAVKRSLGKVQAPPDFAATMLSGGAHGVPVTVEHAAAVERLPWHHRDPFDRILVAQAEIEQATLVSRDEALAAYGVPVIW